MQTRTIEEWQEEYRKKHEFMLMRGYKEVSPYEFYRDLFPRGSLQQPLPENKSSLSLFDDDENDRITTIKSDDKGKGNIIASQLRKPPNKTKQWIIYDDLKLLDKVVGDDFGLIPPISFFGKSHNKKNAHDLFAIAIDVDYVQWQNLRDLLYQMNRGIQLMPTYIVSSGKGVHIYYFLEKPLPLYHNLADMYANIKKALIKRLWNDATSLRPDNPDVTGIYQGFRCVGSQSKFGKDYPVRAYRISENRYTLESIRDFFKKFSTTIDISPMTERPKPPKNKKTIPLTKAKELYPEWYQNRIIDGIKASPPTKKKWTCKIALYEWWKEKIRTEVREGGRYFAIMALCSYGLKCGVSDYRIRRDAYGFLDYLDSITEDEDNHFKRSDIQAALKCLKESRREVTHLSKREWIERHTKVSIPPNKRNYRKQATHIRFMNKIRDFKVELGECTVGGRPKGSGTKAELVAQWRAEHPQGRKIECERDLGLSRHTVLRWWHG